MDGSSGNIREADAVVAPHSEGRSIAPLPDGAIVELPLDEIIFDPKRYPRTDTRPHKLQEIAEKVQHYAQIVDRLDPIEINQHRVGIDFRLRWLAHKEAGRPTIKCKVTHTQNDAEVLSLATDRNTSHGEALSSEDRRRLAQMYAAMTPRPLQTWIAAKLKVSVRTVRTWTARADKDARRGRNDCIRAMWLASHTHEEIAAAVGIDRSTVTTLVETRQNCRSQH